MVVAERIEVDEDHGSVRDQVVADVGRDQGDAVRLAMLGRAVRIGWQQEFERGRERDRNGRRRVAVRGEVQARPHVGRTGARK